MSLKKKIKNKNNNQTKRFLEEVNKHVGGKQYRAAKSQLLKIDIKFGGSDSVWGGRLCPTLWWEGGEQ